MSGEFDDILGDYSNEKEEEIDLTEQIEEIIEESGPFQKISEAYDRVKEKMYNDKCKGADSSSKSKSVSGYATIRRS